MSLLELRRVGKSFGTTPVLAGVDLRVEAGAFLALLGPSGCGKTTLLRLVAGLEQVSAGEIHLAGRVVSRPGVHLPPEQRGLGMVFQTYAVWPHLTVRENVAYPLRVNRRLRQRHDRASRAAAVERALALVHLAGLAERYPHQLSGGQQQRVALARGLVMEPPVLLLDEPLSNLDARLRAEMREELRALHQQLGNTVLYVTHDQREAFAMATQVGVMHAGRILQEGTPEEIRKRPQEGFVREFLDAG